MARYRRSRRYRRRSGRWSPNIVKISSTYSATPGEFFNGEDLAANPIQVNTGVSQTFTVKNLEISFTLEAGISAYVPNPLSNLEAITAYIMYVPQGMNITSGYYADHPEYIMAYKYIGSPSADGNTDASIGQQYQPYKIRSRLSRKLQTGDKIVLYIQGSNEHTANINYNISGIVRWWSKAN